MAMLRCRAVAERAASNEARLRVLSPRPRGVHSSSASRREQLIDLLRALGKHKEGAVSKHNRERATTHTPSTIKQDKGAEQGSDEPHEEPKLEAPTTKGNSLAFNYRLEPRRKVWSQDYTMKIQETMMPNRGFEPIPIHNRQVHIEPNGPARPVATLQHGLDRVLFNPGVHPMKDRAKNRLMFPVHLRKIHQPDEIDFSVLPPFTTTSRDSELHEMAKTEGAKYKGSTSSVSGPLSQIYFLFSRGKLNDISVLPSYRVVNNNDASFTPAALKPVVFFLRPRDGLWSIDSEGSKEVAGNQILLDLGKSLEVMLTTTKDQYENTLVKSVKDNFRFQAGEPEPKVDRWIPPEKESYHYSKFGKCLFRSQLDCHHPDLPNKTFDLKTRAAHDIRIFISDYKNHVSSKLTRITGFKESFEREYYDMVRSAFLKYIIQVRLGNMDGIFVAYHNTLEIFGFEYLQLETMEKSIFETKTMADTSFFSSIAVLEKILDKVTANHPGKVLKIALQAKPRGGDPHILFYVEEIPVENDEGWHDNAHRGSSPDVLPRAAPRRLTDVENAKVFQYRVTLEVFINGIATRGPVLVQEGDDVTAYCKIEHQDYEESIVKDGYLRFLRANRIEPDVEMAPVEDTVDKILAVACGPDPIPAELVKQEELKAAGLRPDTVVEEIESGAYSSFIDTLKQTELAQRQGTVAPPSAPVPTSQSIERSLGAQPEPNAEYERLIRDAVEHFDDFVAKLAAYSFSIFENPRSKSFSASTIYESIHETYPVLETVLREVVRRRMERGTAVIRKKKKNAKKLDSIAYLAKSEFVHSLVQLARGDSPLSTSPYLIVSVNSTPKTPRFSIAPLLHPMDSANIGFRALSAWALVLMSFDRSASRHLPASEPLASAVDLPDKPAAPLSEGETSESLLGERVTRLHLSRFLNAEITYAAHFADNELVITRQAKYQNGLRTSHNYRDGLRWLQRLSNPNDIPAILLHYKASLIDHNCEAALSAAEIALLKSLLQLIAKNPTAPHKGTRNDSSLLFLPIPSLSKHADLLLASLPFHPRHLFAHLPRIVEHGFVKVTDDLSLELILPPPIFAISVNTRNDNE